MSEEVEAISKLLDASLAAKAELEFDLDQGLPAIQGDQTQIRQVIMNLILNAAEAVRDSRGKVKIRTGMRWCDHAFLQAMYFDQALPEKEYAFLEVSDNGCGMDEETQNRIFDPFFTTKKDGHGLGLAAVLGIVRSHQGVVKIDSEPGRGTRFLVVLPIAPTICSSTVQHAVGEVDLRATPSCTVLIIDDEMAVREVAQQILERAGYRVLAAANETDALAICHRQGTCIAAILLDLTLKQTSCIGLLKRLSESYDYPVLISSGFAEVRARELLAAANMPLAGFIQKPYRSKTLIKKLHTILAR